MLETGSAARGAGRAAVRPRLVVTRRATFAAAHVLARADWDAERNRAAFGKCATDHGHNYEVEVAVEGEPQPETGMVIDLKELDRVLHEAVVDAVDHRHLNRDVPWLEGVLPTAENLALAFWARLEPALPAGRLQRVRVVESENNSAAVER